MYLARLNIPRTSIAVGFKNATPLRHIFKIFFLRPARPPPPFVSPQSSHSSTLPPSHFSTPYKLETFLLAGPRDYPQRCAPPGDFLPHFTSACMYYGASCITLLIGLLECDILCWHWLMLRLSSGDIKVKLYVAKSFILICPTT